LTIVVCLSSFVFCCLSFFLRRTNNTIVKRRRTNNNSQKRKDKQHNRQKKKDKQQKTKKEGQTTQ
jgi:flagellar biosynthesis component FlhA